MADLYTVTDIVEFQELRGRSGPASIWKVTAQTTDGTQFEETFEKDQFEPEIVAERLAAQARKIALIRNL